MAENPSSCSDEAFVQALWMGPSDDLTAVTASRHRPGDESWVVSADGRADPCSEPVNL